MITVVDRMLASMMICDTVELNIDIETNIQVKKINTPIVNPPRRRGRPPKIRKPRKKPENKGLNAYQTYVKENFKLVAKENPNLSDAQLMSEVSARWKQKKESESI